MRHLKQPRGPGTGWALRMATPLALVGRVNPHTGKPFGREISIGLKTRRLAEARVRRDIWLGELRKLALGLEADGRFSVERAEAYAEEIAGREANGDDTLDVRSIVMDEIERAESLPPSKRPRRETIERFGRVAMRTGYPIDAAVTRYLEERAAGNRREFKELKRTTVNDVHTAVGYLKQFMELEAMGLCLQDIDRRAAQRFRFEFLPERTTTRAPHGLAAKTVGKHVTLLSGVWSWAKERGFLDANVENPWVGFRGVPRAKGARRNGAD